MDKTTKFPISRTGYEIEGLIGIDAPRLVPLYQGCSDYLVLERGQPPNAASAKEEFESFPPNRTEADKFVFGLKAIDGELVGLLACDRNYPQVGCWWIALVMIDKALRGRGLARALCDDFFTWLKSQHVKRVELAVFTENEQALRFWQRQGFELVRTAGPVSIGAKRHMLQILSRSL
ncbi:MULTISPECIES: GNAT family N-acetyltransferase [Mesorhizobium]|uniref:GNAT family N-acetyltransferase n=1 Tax=Mesorhizobium TaxID=68287 RepID=UPI000FE78BD6|nr:MULTISPECIES: GNAT family N-acetyltransferase [Mesorhizobium]MCF6112554.1 GNAT family N-acetyltransferase [Mesorhizobium muleiense]RWO87054.1 MAG: GNAT family N-acetyltransferase [Mesorhizobium sp.]RWQ55609.1 MAG: GNAT family N-acetyltransferase [Mesorhizobium sp.]